MMTNVQIESQPPRIKRARKRADEAGQLIKYDGEAIAKGKQLVAKLKAQDKAVHLTETELGELADRLKTKYGDKTLEHFAKDIGIAAARLKRCRSEYRAWKGKEAPAPISSAVRRELQAHPSREEIVREQPNLTKAAARGIMRAYRQAHEEEMDWRVAESRRWFAGVVKRAQDAVSDGHPARSHIDPLVLRQAIDHKDETVASLRLGGKAWLNLADIVERAFVEDETVPDQA